MIEIIPNWHPFVVHFAIGLLMISALLFLAAGLLSWTPVAAGMTSAARWNLWLGTAFAVLSVLSGWQAYQTVIHDTAGHDAMHVHRLWALISLFLFLLASILSFFELHRKHGASLPLLIVMLAGFGTIAVTGYLGAKNVYEHGIGVQRLPDPADLYHHHDGDHPDDLHGHDHDHTDHNETESGEEEEYDY